MTFAAEIPLFLAIFGGIVAGLFIGFVWEWLREMKHRSTASTKSREVTRLERELAVLRDSTSVPKDEVLALLDAPKPR
jgi:lipopolysaccharide assembly protein A